MVSTVAPFLLILPTRPNRKRDRSWHVHQGTARQGKTKQPGVCEAGVTVNSRETKDAIRIVKTVHAKPLAEPSSNLKGIERKSKGF